MPDIYKCINGFLLITAEIKYMDNGVRSIIEYANKQQG